MVACTGVMGGEEGAEESEEVRDGASDEGEGESEARLEEEASEGEGERVEYRREVSLTEVDE